MEGESRSPDATEAPPDEEPVVCAACQSPVTHTREAILVNGEHQHVCANPAGIMFVVRCFRVAHTQVIGFPSSAATWFPGHAWQIALCTGCRAHLGWLFTGASEFYGLIAANIR